MDSSEFEFGIQTKFELKMLCFQVSNPISLFEIKQACETKAKSIELVKNVDQYVHVIGKNKIFNGDRKKLMKSLSESDSSQFLRKIDDSSGGLYAVDMKHAFEELTWSVIENIITQRFGTKATRIFRYEISTKIRQI